MPTRRRGKKSCHDPTANWNALEFIPQPYLRLVAMPAWSHSTAREMAVGPTEVRDCAETLVGARGLEPAIPTTRIVVPSWAVNALAAMALPLANNDQVTQASSVQGRNVAVPR